MNDEKQSNIFAIIGFLLILLNITVSIILIVIGQMSILLIFASITALISLVLCIFGLSKSKESGRGKALSIIGLILNILILIALALFIGVIILFAEACSGIFQGLTPN